MDAQAPTISIVMSALNAARTVEESIRSILGQSFADWELVFINDGSTDATLEIVSAHRDPRIRIVNEAQRAGVAARLNQGIALARGRYIARLDADDIAYPERLARQLAFLEAHPNVDLVGCAILVFSDVLGPFGAARFPTEHDAICAAPQLGFPIAASAWMARRSWFLRYPYWDSAIRSEEQGILLRSYRESRFANLPEILVAYRQETPRIRHILRGRWDYIRQLGSYAVQHRETAFAAAGFATQIIRGAVGVGLIGMGQGEALLRRRYPPAPKAEIARWQSVRKLLGAPILPTGAERPPRKAHA